MLRKKAAADSVVNGLSNFFLELPCRIAVLYGFWVYGKYNTVCRVDSGPTLNGYFVPLAIQADSVANGLSNLFLELPCRIAVPYGSWVYWKYMQ
jgi:hypothetical protein